MARRNPIRGNAEFLKRNDAFAFAAKTLTRSYLLVSRTDSRENMWRPLHLSIKYVTRVENQARASNRAYTGLHSRITADEMSRRLERHSVGQADRNLSSAPLIELARRRHSIWHLVSELKPVSRREEKGEVMVRRGSPCWRRNGMPKRMEIPLWPLMFVCRTSRRGGV